MKKYLTRSALSALLLTMIVTSVPVTHAEEEGTADLCIESINARLASEQRLYRTVLFGMKKAADEPIGKLRYSKKGSPWVKMGANKWVSSTEEGRALSNEGVDEETEGIEYPSEGETTKIRKGIFETRGVLTSELIPSLTQSYRALDCRIAILCETVRLSAESAGLESDASFTVSVPGCGPLDEVPVLESCQSGTEGTEETVTTQVQRAATILTYCRGAGEKLVNRERDLLKAAVTYDAAYRTLLQFAGNFDAFLGGFKITLLTQVREAVSLLGSFTRLPCFLSECNE